MGAYCLVDCSNKNDYNFLTLLVSRRGWSVANVHGRTFVTGNDALGGVVQGLGATYS